MRNKEGESALADCLRDDYSNDFRPVDSKITANLIVKDPTGFKSLFGQAGEDHVNRIIARAQELREQAILTQPQVLEPGKEAVLAAA